MRGTEHVASRGGRLVAVGSAGSDRVAASRSRATASTKLDRPGSMLKDNLRDYRRLGSYVDSRIALRKAMARFWARGNADESIERSMRRQIESRPLEDLE
jgi:hypothetical protein